MKTIGIELNHVVRNINKQILKYYDKEFKKNFDLDEMDTNEDVYKYISFDSKKANNNFFFIDYPYEIYGCAETVDRFLAVRITNWIADLKDFEDEEIKIIFYSLNEDALTIQSTYFFLSKIGARVRKMIFPENIQEVWDECDIVVTANKEFLENTVPEGKKVILINKPFNESVKDMAYKNYDSLTSLIEDENFLKQLCEDNNEEKINSK